MQPDVNICVISGCVCGNPTYKTNLSYGGLCKFKLLSQRFNKNETEEIMFDVISFSAVAETCSKHLYSGRPIVIIGEFRSWNKKDKNGDTKEVICIIAKKVRLYGYNSDVKYAQETTYADLEIPKFEDIAEEGDLPF